MRVQRHIRRVEFMAKIEAAGKAGVPLTELMALAGVKRPDIVWRALQPELDAGTIKRQMPTGNRPAAVYMAQHFPAPTEPKPRVYKNLKASEKSVHQQAAWLDYIRAKGKTGAMMRELELHFGVSNQTASGYVQGLAQRGLVSGMVADLSHGKRKTWFVLEFAPTFTLPKSAEKKQAGTLDPKAPAIIPAGLVPIKAPTPVDRFAFNPPPGWKGQISAAEARPWDQMVAG